MRRQPGTCLAAKAQAIDERTVALNVDVMEVAEHTTTLTHNEQEATT